MNTQEIATKLALDPRTARKHIRQIEQELESAHGSAEVGRVLQALDCEERAVIEDIRSADSIHARVKARDQRLRILRDRARLLKDTGEIEVAAKRVDVSVTNRVDTSIIDHWTDEVQDFVALAIIQSRLEPLAEPGPPSPASEIAGKDARGLPAGS